MAEETRTVTTVDDAGGGSGGDTAKSGDTPIRAQAPQTLGKYRLFAGIGSGGMAEVYLAVAEGQLGFNKLVVVKRLRPNLAGEEEFVQMFLDEARLAARLNHANIVHTYEVGEEGGNYFIAMEYLEGQPLKRLLSQAAAAGKTLPRGVALRVVIDALVGLGAAHDLVDYGGKPLRIIHRDISPHNVFVCYDGAVKVVDFGIAKAAVNSTQTQTGQLKGKPGYMAPEQAVSSEIDQRADLFAMGVVLWEILTSKRLFAGDTVQALHKMMSMDIPAVSSLVPEVDAELDEIVAKSLRRKPEERYQTAEEMRRALERYARSKDMLAEVGDVGRYASETFADVRGRVRAQVEQQMAAARTRVSSPLASSPSLPQLSMSGSGRVATGGGATPPRLSMDFEDQGQSASGAPPMPEPPAPRRRGAMIAMGVVVVALAGALAVVGLRGGAKPEATAAASATSVPPASAPSSGATAASPPAAETAPVTIMSDPSGATVTWGGRARGVTPVIVEMPAGAQTIVVDKDGFEQAVATVNVAGGGGPSLTTVRLVRRKNATVAWGVAPSRPASPPADPSPPAPSPAPSPPATAATPPDPAPPPADPAPAPSPTIRIIDDPGKTKVRVVQ